MRYNRYTHSVIVTLGLALAVTGCAATDTAQSTDSSATASFMPASTPSPTSTKPTTAGLAEPTITEGECLSEMRVGIIASGWELVVASHGASDHFDMAESFDESVQGASDANEISAGLCRGNVELAELQFESAVLRTHVLAQAVAEPDIYENAVEAGNAWFESIERDDYELSAP